MAAPHPDLPLVTCVMPVFNYERYVAAAIESALAQTYPAERLEVIVVDDGSTDATPEAVAPYADRVQLLRKENGGILSAVNLGLARARGELIAFLDADDLWLPGKVAHQVAHFAAHPQLGLVYGDMEVVDAEGRLGHPSFMAMQQLEPITGRVLGPLLAQNHIPGGSTMIRARHRDCFFPIPDAAAWTDWWFAARIAEVAEVGYQPEALYRYRRHGENTLFGSEGQKAARARRDDEIPWRRWLLGSVPPGAVSARHLMDGYVALVAAISRTARELGVAEPEVAPAGDRERARAREALARAAAAAGKGDDLELARHTVHALAADPFDLQARALAATVLDGLDAGPAAERTPEGLVPGARATVVLAWAEELIGAPELLGAYVREVHGEDEVTLVAYAPDGDEAAVVAGLTTALAAAGADGEAGPDVMAHVAARNPRAEAGLARRAALVLSRAPQAGAFAALPRLDGSRAGDLRELIGRSAAAQPAAAALRG